MKRADTTHGSADWGKGRDLKRLGLLNSSGVVLGRTKKGKLVSDSSDSHVFLCAPTRSGKGVGVVIPTLFSWKESVIVFDLKGENWEKTAHTRSKFSVPLYFNPRSKLSAKFNPLLEVRKGDLELHDVRQIVQMLSDPSGREKKDHWLRSARTLLEALILHVLYAGEDKSLGGVANFIFNPQLSAPELLKSMILTQHLKEGPHPVVASTSLAMLDKSDAERSGVVSTAREYVALFRDPVIARALKTSDFNIKSLTSSDFPVSLYLVIGPNDLLTLAPLMRLLLSQVVQRLCERKEKRAFKLLLLLDEFPALGTLEFFEAQLAFIAGYGIKVVIIVQSMNQLLKLYGPHQTILDNMKYRLFFAPNTLPSAETVSKMLGSRTLMHQTKSRSGKRVSATLSNMSLSEQKTARLLLTPDEVMRMASETSLLLVGNERPQELKKVFYYKEREFKGHDKGELKLLSGSYPYRLKIEESPWKSLAPISFPATPEEECRPKSSGVRDKRLIAF